jgi:hypothetical protein
MQAGAAPVRVGLRVARAAAQAADFPQDQFHARAL